MNSKNLNCLAFREKNEGTKKNEVNKHVGLYYNMYGFTPSLNLALQMSQKHMFSDWFSDFMYV